MMKYLTIPVTPFEQNCSLVWCDTTRHAALIDPGGDVERLYAAIEAQQLTLQAVWLTHGHLDHVGGTVAVADQYAVPVIGPHQDDAFWLDALPLQSQQFGFPHHDAFTPTRWLTHGETLTLGEETFNVLHTPGHTPGHVVLFNKNAQIAFVGDVLFAGSIGRTDFPKGNHQQLITAIKEHLWSLGDETEVVPGHGPNTTIGHERLTNMYVR